MYKKQLITAIGAVAATSLAFGAFAANTDNPFEIEDLDTSYLLANANFGGEEGKCGDEGKCGEGTCGDDEDKDEEGACGEGTCGQA